MAAVKDLSADFSAIRSDNENHTRAWQRGMDAARIELEQAQLKREFLEWVNNNEINDPAHFGYIPDWKFLTLGRMAWLMNNGAEIPAESAEFFMRQIEELRKFKGERTEDQTSDDVLTPEQKRVELYVNLYSRIDALRNRHADDTEALEEEILKVFKAVNPNMAMLKRLYQHYRESLTDAINGRENELVEATIEPLVAVVNVLAGSTGNAKNMNALRKKVGNKAAKAASKAVVKTVDKDTNITGLTPVLLVGNTSALVYNSKDRKAQFYVAKAGETLGVKGTYITGYDEAASFGKTLRKPKEIFDKILHNANPKRISGALDKHVKGKRHELNGKLNKDTLIIKIFK